MARPLTAASTPPATDQCELTLFGPGYGECVVMHIGGGDWVVVDSCLTTDGSPSALRYLEEIGVDPAQAVVLVVATHWHDDHIRGLAQILKACPAAQFCAAGLLCREEFSTLVSALEGRHFSASGSGLRELFTVFTLLRETRRTPVHAMTNRLVHRTDSCRLWALSPSDQVFQKFLRAVGGLVPRVGGDKRRIPSLSPNEVAVVLWAECGESALLLGSDMERQGWVAIVEDSARPPTKASVFKVPHHGSGNAHVPAVWEQMLELEPVAVLAPWRRGRGSLPSAQDAERILRATPHAWITSGTKPAPFRHAMKAVEETLRESGVRVRRLVGDESRVRLRRSMGSDQRWTVEAFGSAGRLLDYAA